MSSEKITNDDKWVILKSLFDEKGLVRQHLDSYNDFIEYKMQEIVDESVIRSDPNRTMIPANIVNAVCHVPYACHPSYAQGYYDRDNEFYLEWDKISSSQEGVENWLAEWVFGVENHAEYWSKLGSEKHKQLEIKPRMSESINYGEY